METHLLWDFRIAIDLFLGGIGVGAFLYSLYLLFVHKGKYMKQVLTGFILGPCFVGLGVLVLLTELGRPLRMLSTFINVNPTSVTSWGGFLQFIFIVIGLIAAFLTIKYGRQSLENTSYSIVVLTGGVFAIAVGFYHGLLLTSVGNPMWMNGLLPILFFISSLICGSVFVSLIGNLVGNLVGKVIGGSAYAEVAAANDEAPLNPIKVVMGLLFIELIIFGLWIISTNYIGLDGKEAFANMISEYGIYWWTLVLGVGIILPIIISFFVTKCEKVSKTIIFALLCFILIGSYSMKHIILYAGQIL
ncbi:polysulfide reductase NrfD [Bacillus sp. Bva_UNVM-123]|uniref:NrfD/PsrC family molybdoenzyme membrane anchor subunit n=1 Tax=Bacillus sp. Bva_UNVM-123 TaxID=2829798 RepID=UPI00391FB52C